MKKTLIILLHAFIGWSLCAAIMGIGMAVTSEINTLIIHAIGAPLFFGIISWIYTKKFGYTSPLATAVIFVTFVIVIDFFLVAMVLLKSFDMFKSFLGTWLPFSLLFFSSFISGIFAQKR